MATATDHTRKAGDTYPVPLLIADEDGTAVDLTGATSITLGIDPDYENTAPDDAQLSVAGTIVDAAGGELSFTATGIALLDVGNYWAEVQYIQAGYKRSTSTFQFIVLGQIITS